MVRSTPLGSLTVELGELVEKCKVHNGERCLLRLSYILDLQSVEIEIAIIPPPSQKIPQGAPRIKLRLHTPRPDVAPSSAIVSNQNASSSTGPGTGATVVSHIDSIQAIIPCRGGAFDTLKTVLSKIDIFVKIVDKTASVGACIVCFLGPFCLTNFT
jgi:hypothetical protein